MFRSKRSGLVRRIWRSRLIPDTDGGDGSARSSEGGPDDWYDGNPEKIPKTEYLPETGVENVAESCNRSLAESGGPLNILGHDGGCMCDLQQHDTPCPAQGGEDRTVMCCFFKDLPKAAEPAWDTDGISCPSARNIRNQKDIHSTGGKDLRCVSFVEHELKRCTYAFLKKMKEKPLEMLLEAVESKGVMQSDCIIVSQTELRIGSQMASPQYLLCKLYRWTDLELTSQLKPLCHCQSFWALDSPAVCCNPYHYSRLCGPDSPPPPYSRHSLTVGHKPLDRSNPMLPLTENEGTHSPCVTSGDFSDASLSLVSVTQRPWCSVAYWEHRTRVGRLYPVYEPFTSIFFDLPQGSGFCLGQLPLEACGSSVQRTRAKIGHGILLSKEPDGVWAYNRSQHPIFVNSPTLDSPHCRSLTVLKVLPGYSLKVFDFEKSCHVQRGVDFVYVDGPYDPNSVRISFAKGWGPCYSRQFITSCPCWLEILLNKHR
ncbi:mothers against decapentaplegic homolog 6a [Chanos chanos]|uniref:Mothers against decapentaplegic homolog n=1 Tax=Chanos chanos TaxID=29144 RepID=A0A6J2UK42_CHACN|nr:mothers against decapentaplegic homolog 6-like [Chanos chanos]